MPEADMSTYRFNRHAIVRQFRPVYGVARAADGSHRDQRLAAVDVLNHAGVEPADPGNGQMDDRSP